MSDDPLFDPWSTVEVDPADETPADSPAESSNEPQTTPKGPLPGRPTRTKTERSTPRWRSTPKTSDMPGAPSDMTRPRAAEPSRGHSASRVSSTLTERLEDVAIPHLKALEARLQIARHRTLLDDRLGRTPPTIRFRIIPRRGPFDDVSAVPGSALEIVANDDASVSARLWLDPVAEEPAEEHSVDGARFGEAWIDEITMDFVEKALRRR